MVLDSGATREEAWRDSPDKGLLIESMMSRENYDLSPDCVLLVLASERYDDADHIRSYDDFIGLAGNA